MTNPFVDTLKNYWGYDQFRPLQEDIISSVYEGKDTLGLMPTGGGKSLTFQVPALLMPGVCIVITPLIALMKDQVDNLRRRGIKAAAVYSGMSRQEIIVALENCIFGDYKFLYISPERLNTELFLSKLQYMQVSLLAVDESHCISQWGYDFRPAYLKIAEIRKLLPEIPVLALTATATEEVVNDIQDRLLFKEKNVFRKSFERKNIAYVIRKTEDKLFEMIRILTKVPGSGIVYVRSRKKTKEIALELKAYDIDADFFHAGLSPEEKNNKQNRWKSGECRIMVCTNAFGMGIDKPDVRVVIHFEMPASLEEYFQEAGRAGRDEEPAYAVALYSGKDAEKLKKRVQSEFPEREYIKEVYEKLACYLQVAINSGFQRSYNFELENFCTVFKYSFTQVHYALRLLQLSGYIEYVDEVNMQSRIMFIVHRDDLYRYSGLSEEIDQVIQILLRSYTGLFSDYVYIKESLLASRTGLSHHQVYEILKALSSQQIVHYIPAQKTPVITYTQNREDIQYLQIPPLVYEDRKKRLETRIRNVLEYGERETECRSKLLLRYFGEKRAEPCGQCDVCLKRKKESLSDEKFNKIEDEIKRLVRENQNTVELLLAGLDYPEELVLKTIRFLLDNEAISLKDGIIYCNTNQKN